MPLPKALRPVAEAYPRLPHEASNNAAYARRLHELSQRGDPLARVADQPLNIAQLALLSGATQTKLKLEPQLQPLPEALKPVAEAYPRLPHEARNNAVYARRLHGLSQRDEPLARVGDQPLSLAQVALLSGVREDRLRLDPQLQPLPEALKPVAEAYPRLPNEASNNAAYARRLHGLSERDEPLARVGDQPLSLEQLSLLSGATMLQLRRDPHLQPLPAALRPVADAFPRLPAEANTDTAYARRLHALSQADQPLARVGDQPLSIAQLALLSGVTERQLNADPMFMPLPQELKRVAEAFPRLPGEADNALAYASRLHELSLRGDPLARVRDQPLKTAQLALLSGIAEYQLRLTLIHPG